MPVPENESPHAERSVTTFGPTKTRPKLRLANGASQLHALEVPRRPRLEGAGLIHHVTGRSLPARTAFPDDAARRTFLTLVASSVRSSRWVVFASCVLSTHYHLLLRTTAPNLGAGMQRIHGRHAQLMNARYSTAGPLWRGRFHSSVVESAFHVVHAAAYIDANPVDAGICVEPEHWGWSSYCANAGLTAPLGWHRPHALHAFMGADETDAPRLYRNLVAAAIERAHARRKASQS